MLKKTIKSIPTILLCVVMMSLQWSKTFAQTGDNDANYVNSNPDANNVNSEPDANYVNSPPPELPQYQQPPCPEEGLMWTPGYWAFGNDGYFWVPGAWINPPRPNYLWTPCWWEFIGGRYRYHEGYWGEHIGFYGGVNYGYGYFGSGFNGGRWEGGHFRYNTAIMNVDRGRVHNFYEDRTVVNHVTVVNRTSFNGPGGIRSTPQQHEMEAMHESHISATSQQVSHSQTYSANRSQFASANRGRPTTTSVNTVNGDRFNNHGVSTTNRSTTTTRTSTQSQQSRSTTSRSTSSSRGNQGGGGNRGGSHKR